MAGVLRRPGALALPSLEGMRLLAVGRTAATLLAKTLPAVFPLELSQMSSSDFVTVAVAHKQHFESHHGPVSVNEVVEEKYQLLKTRRGSWQQP